MLYCEAGYQCSPSPCFRLVHCLNLQSSSWTNRELLNVLDMHMRTHMTQMLIYITAVTRKISISSLHHHYNLHPLYLMSQVKCCKTIFAVSPSEKNNSTCGHHWNASHTCSGSWYLGFKSCRKYSLQIVGSYTEVLPRKHLHNNLGRTKCICSLACQVWK